MMQIVYFSQKAQLWEHFKDLKANLQFIAPSPAKADSLRLQLGAAGLPYDVLTIAKFTGNLVTALWDNEAAPTVKRKADLLLIFGILKNRYFPELGYEQFMQGYNLFSDLRSFSMDENALSAVMEEQPEEVKKAVSLFWQLLGLTGFLDEHGAYHQLAEKLRSGEEKDELKKVYVFWGFQHLNGQQIDLLKALAIRYPVIIPFPLSLKENLKRSDWLSWLKESRVEEIDLPSLPTKLKAKWLKVNSRELASNLKNILQDGDQVVLGVSKLSPLHLDTLPSNKVSFKIPHQLVEAEIQELASKLKQEFRSEQKMQDLQEFLLSERKKYLSLRKPAFKKLKAIELYLAALTTIAELTDDPPSLDSFFLKLLNDVVALNQPRTSYVPLAQHELSIELKDMSSLQDIDPKRRTLLCVDERFDEIQSLGQNYTETIQKALSHLGPLKRNELELLFKGWELNDLFSQGEVLVLMSESTLKHSLIWKRLLSQVELSLEDSKGKRQERRLKDHFQSVSRKSFVGNFSATKFQTFIDCPRRFYFSYVHQVFPKVTLEKDFDSLASGTISHRIIEVFHKRQMSLSALPELTSEIMKEFIQEKDLHLPREIYLKRRLEFFHRSHNGISFLQELETLLNEKITWKMEEEFEFIEEYKVTGKMDAIGMSDNTVFLMDFKSTGGSVPSKKDVLNMDHLQLWTYAQAASRSLSGFAQKNIVMGFISLDKPSDSLLMVSSGDHYQLLSPAKMAKLELLEENLNELLKASQEKMTSIALAIKAEKDFPALPRTSKACHFCELTKVCVKGQVAHE